MTENRRLIEDYLPIERISAEARREKSVRKGHISTLHLWWARRPLVACRAAVYGALIPASRFVPQNGPQGKRASLGRANAAKFIERLCKYPGDPKVIAEAQRHIFEAHAERLSGEMGHRVTAEDIEAGHAPRPKVLDMFAGGGAIPLEALRLGCDAYALELNPVAYMIELCTLVYPQKYGKPDPNAKGSAKDGTWAGLAEEVCYWGEWVLNKVKAEIGDLYPLIPDPEFKGKGDMIESRLFQSDDAIPPGYLTPVAYLWSRTVTCKNPSCRATVPLVRQTWLCKRDKRYVALKIIAPEGAKCVRFKVVEETNAKNLGFDPEAGSKGGNATCPFCGTVADNNHVKTEGRAGRMGQQLMAVVCVRPGAQGKEYLAADAVTDAVPFDEIARNRLSDLSSRTGLTVPNEAVALTVAGGGGSCHRYGMVEFGQVFTPRQRLALLATAASITALPYVAHERGMHQDRILALITMLSLTLGRLANQNSTLGVFNSQRGTLEGAVNDKKIPMTWDFPEAVPIGRTSGSWSSALENVQAVVKRLASDTIDGAPVSVYRGDASVFSSSILFDAIITDPPYLDNYGYSDLSDFFYVWMKRSIGQWLSEHFAGELTPKKVEAIADTKRHGGSKAQAVDFYQGRMRLAFERCHELLKPGGDLVCIYAHKTTSGWQSFVDALRFAGFEIREAWPIDTERSGGLKTGTASLASSITLYAKKRDPETGTGSYEEIVRPELETIVRERVNTLWDQGVSGADLVIACIGAGLRAFTRFARVEYANGEEVPAERFLTEVETVVLDGILGRLSKETGTVGRTSLEGVDPPTRFYTLWRYTYRTVELDAGEVIIFANGTHVELDGPSGLSSGVRALVEKKKGKYRLCDYAERGDDEKLGMPTEDGQPVPLVDALHRTLWLMENRPADLAEFLREAQPNREQLRLVAQALAGPALKGGELPDVSPTGELAALAKLTANWKSVIEDAAMTSWERTEQRTGQPPLDFGERGRP